MPDDRLNFLPTTREDMLARSVGAPDFVLVTGDAYVDHPSFGAAVIGRVLEDAGYSVCVLAQPDWRGVGDFKRFGRPKLGFLITSGNMDSMVNHYTAAKKPRSRDAYSPGGRTGSRPDRALVVYVNRAREAYARIPVVLGGVEGSLRRFAHYDYWSDSVRRSVLVDAGADILVYGMGEDAMLSIAARLRARKPLSGIPGTCVLMEDVPEGAVAVPPYDAVKADKRAFAEAFRIIDGEQDPVRGRALAQRHEKCTLVQYPPAMPLTKERFDRVCELPYARRAHPDAEAADGVPALEEVQFSLTATRGCFGQCSFCALTHHQGRIVTSRGTPSLVREAEAVAALPGFKGYIHDVGGPTANFRRPACSRQLKEGACRSKRCLAPEPCKRLEVDHTEFIESLDAVARVKGVKRVFVRSGVRYDYMMLDKNPAVMERFIARNVSGQLKVAPEHVSPAVLKWMGKPSCGVYDAFAERFYRINTKRGMEQYLVPYFLSSHPGCGLNEAVELAEYMRATGCRPEQVQDFYPTPGTRSTCMYHTGLDPMTMKPVYVPRTPREKAMQRALLQYARPENARLVREALRVAGREDLIGYGKRCLVRPERGEGRGGRRRG